MTNEYRYFYELNLEEGTRLFILFYLNWNHGVIRYSGKKYYLPKSFIKNYKVIINRKNLHDQPLDSDIKQYKEIRKLTTV